MPNLFCRILVKFFLSEKFIFTNFKWLTRTTIFKVNSELLNFVINSFLSFLFNLNPRPLLFLQRKIHLAANFNLMKNTFENKILSNLILQKYYSIKVREREKHQVGLKGSKKTFSFSLYSSHLQTPHANILTRWSGIKKQKNPRSNVRHMCTSLFSR